MKKKKKTRIKKRLPIEAALRLRSHPITTQKGDKGYSRKKLKDQNRKDARKNIFEENH